jgi:hypothetical protein
MAQSINAIRLSIEPVRSLPFGSISGTYAAIGHGSATGAAMVNPIRQFMLQNLTDVSLMFSIDGINDAFPLPTNGYLIDDITSNKTVSVGFFLAEGTILYVKSLSGNPSTGSVYFTTFYGNDL